MAKIDEIVKRLHAARSKRKDPNTVVSSIEFNGQQFPVTQAQLEQWIERSNEIHRELRDIRRYRKDQNAQHP